MKKKYTLEELKSMLIDFHNSHPYLGDTDEWYGDQARMTTGSVCQFIQWIEKGDYRGDIDDVYETDDKNKSIVGFREP